MKLKFREEESMMLPNLSPTKTDPTDLGPFATRRLSYLKKERPTLYTELLTSGRLEDHLMEVQRSASEMTEVLVSRSAQALGIDETMKRDDPERWVQAMGEIRATADSTVMREVVLA